MRPDVSAESLGQPGCVCGGVDREGRAGRRSDGGNRSVGRAAAFPIWFYSVARQLVVPRPSRRRPQSYCSAIALEARMSSIGDVIRAYLDFLRVRVEAGDLALASLERSQKYLKVFAK